MSIALALFPVSVVPFKPLSPLQPWRQKAVAAMGKKLEVWFMQWKEHSDCRLGHHVELVVAQDHPARRVAAPDLLHELDQLVAVLSHLKVEMLKHRKLSNS